MNSSSTARVTLSDRNVDQLPTGEEGQHDVKNSSLSAAVGEHTVEFDDVLFCGWLDAIPSPPKASHGLLQGSVSFHHATSRLAARRVLPFGVQHGTTNVTSTIHVAASGKDPWQLHSRGRGVWQAQPSPDARNPERVFQLALFAYRVQ